MCSILLLLLNKEGLCLTQLRKLFNSSYHVHACYKNFPADVCLILKYM